MAPTTAGRRRSTRSPPLLDCLTGPTPAGPPGDHRERDGHGSAARAMGGSVAAPTRTPATRTATAVDSYGHRTTGTTARPSRSPALIVTGGVTSGTGAGRNSLIHVNCLLQVAGASPGRTIEPPSERGGSLLDQHRHATRPGKRKRPETGRVETTRSGTREGPGTHRRRTSQRRDSPSARSFSPTASRATGQSSTQPLLPAHPRARTDGQDAPQGQHKRTS
jgi:hypothetical protein